MNLKISIIIATYNRCYCISNAIDSIFNAFYQQPRNTFEIIIVDDCSTDATESLIREKYSSEISNKVICYERLDSNKGVSGARNHGVLKANGDWVLFFDSDDTLIHNVGHLMVKELESYLAEPIVFFRCIDQDDNFVGVFFSHKTKRISLNEYLMHSSYGEALTAVRTSVMLNNLFLEELRGYEGYTLAKILKSHDACAVLSNLIARKYIQTGVDRLSNRSGFRKRYRLLAKGHFLMVNEFSNHMPYSLVFQYLIKSALYYIYVYTIGFLVKDKFY